MRVNISPQALRSHRNKKEITFNDSYNIANKLGTRLERAFILEVVDHKHGIYNQPITKKDIEDYINSLTASELEQIRNKYKSLIVE